MNDRTIPDAVSATERGVFGFLTKPFDSQELLQKVAAALKLSGDDAPGGGTTGGEWRQGIITRSARRDNFGKTCTTASTSCRCISLRLRKDAKTSRYWFSIFCPNLPLG